MSIGPIHHKQHKNMDEINMFEFIDQTETQEFYSADHLIERSKILELEKNGTLTLKEGQDIKQKGTLARLKDQIARKNILYIGKFVCETPINIETTTGNVSLSLIDEKQIQEKISKIRSTDRKNIAYIHISTIQILIRSTYLKGIDSPIKIVVIDNRIQHPTDRIIGMIEGNLGYSVVKFDVSLQYAIPLATKNISNSIGIGYQFKRKELMEKGDMPFSVTYAIGYALSNSHHSIEYKYKEKISIEDLFRETSTKLKVLKEPTYLEKCSSSRFNINPPRLIKEKTETDLKIDQIDRQVKNIENGIQSIQSRIG